jgi:hypothetical protein
MWARDKRWNEMCPSDPIQESVGNSRLLYIHSLQRNRYRYRETEDICPDFHRLSQPLA